MVIYDKIQKNVIELTQQVSLIKRKRTLSTSLEWSVVNESFC
jgi:hypothetical protein